MIKFDGAVAIVTGGGRGLGRAHALMLASRGCRVIVNDLGVRSTGAISDADPADDVVATIVEAGGQAIADRHDIVTEADAVVAAAMQAFGRLDILINNAGTLDGGTFATTPASVWQRVSDVHYRGTVEACRAAWPYLVAAPSGRIVNTSSSAMFGGPQLSSYGSAKAAIYGLTKSLAIEGQADGIGVNAIMPAALTRMTERIDDPGIRRVLKEHLTPDRVASFVAWLAHPSTSVTGQVFRISGCTAARVVMAVEPSVTATNDTPESWAAAERELLGPAGLTEIKSTMDCFSRELLEADRNLDLKATFESGGVLHDEAEQLD